MELVIWKANNVCFHCAISKIRFSFARNAPPGDTREHLIIALYIIASSAKPSFNLQLDKLSVYYIFYVNL